MKRIADRYAMRFPLGKVYFCETPMPSWNGGLCGNTVRRKGDQCPWHKKHRPRKPAGEVKA